MHFGFNQQILSRGYEYLKYLVQEFFSMWDLVHHPKGQSKIDLPVYSYPVRFGSMQVNAMGNPRRFRPPSQHIQHILLDIDGYNGAFFAYEVGQAYSEVSHTAANIYGGHALFHIRTKHLFGVMKQSTETIVESIC
jgi:hypothetical protein